MLKTDYRPAALALINMTQHEPARAIIFESDAISLLIDKLGKCDGGLAAIALSFLSKQDHKDRGRILQKLPIKELVEMLQGPDRRPAAFALAALAERDDTLRSMVDAKAIPALLKTLDSTDCLPAARAFAWFARYESTRVQIDYDKTLPALVSMLGGLGHYEASKTLVELYKHNDSQDVIDKLYNPMPEVLSELLNSTNHE